MSAWVLDWDIGDNDELALVDGAGEVWVVL
jgi:hypothetical protein